MKLHVNFNYSITLRYGVIIQQLFESLLKLYHVTVSIDT